MYNKVLSKSRMFFNNYINPIITIDKCEVCGEVNNLHTHHNEPLSSTVRGVLSDYSNIDDIDVLVDIVTAQSVKCGFTVVCEECHREFHKSDMGDLVSYGMSVDKERAKQEHRAQLELYLNSVVGQRLYKEEQQELIDKVGLKNQNGRTVRGVTLLSEHIKSLYSEKYELINKRDRKQYDANGEMNENYNKTYWQVLTIS